MTIIFLIFQTVTLGIKNINKKVLSNNTKIELDLEISNPCKNRCKQPLTAEEKDDKLKFVNEFKKDFYLQREEFKNYNIG